MKILISGGAGFIGTKLIKKLINSNEIIVLDNFLEQIHGTSPVLIDGVKYIKGDVRNESDWNTCFDYDPDVILHLASETGTGQSMDEINRYTTTNIVGTSILLDVLNNRKNNVKKLVLSSSRAVYGDDDNIETNDSLKPKSIYAVTKLTQELLIKTGCNIPYTILRYQNVYGDGQSLNNPYTGIISIFSNNLHKGLPIEIYDNGKPTRDFIYVEDVVDATIMCLDNGISDFKLYNVGTGKETSILEIANKLNNLFGNKSEIKITDYHRSGDIMYAKANVTKIKKDLNWSYKFDINYGLNEFYNWFLTKNKK